MKTALQQLVDVKVTDSSDYDLFAEVVKES